MENRIPLKDKVVKWFERTGFPTEMIVANSFKEAGFRVTQGPYFTDPDTGVEREIDLIASWSGDILGRSLRIVFVVECKWSKNRPWVTFSNPSPTLSYDRICLDERLVSFFGNKLLNKFKSDENLSSQGFFSCPSEKAYTLRAININDDQNNAPKSKNGDIAYDSVRAISASSMSICSVLKKSPIAAVVFPLIVFDGNLFDCKLKEKNELVANEIEYATLIWNNPTNEKPRSLIHISTLSAHKQIVKLATETKDAFFGLDATKACSALGQPSGKIKADDLRLDF
jgi:hypothetical protein